MKRTNTLSLAVLTFAMLLGFSGAAHAALENIVIGSTDGNFSVVGSGATLTPNVNLQAARVGGSLVLINDSRLLSNSHFSAHFTATRPTGSLFGHRYLAVDGERGTGDALFTLDPGMTSFGFTWGTIDAYNTLIVTDSRGYTFAITGTNILNAIAGSIAGNTQSNIDITDAFGTITSAIFTSTKDAFEVANFSQSAVPLPATLALFGMALFGLFAVRRYRPKGAKAA
ncbi:MAG TPA: PEP-CTERM sorting domain-containing protein [Alphaproteobacteria bacterium]|nr:PEP-CTERM sorting domain-containing protein [Alphaproteobacteria bacterium]